MLPTCEDIKYCACNLHHTNFDECLTQFRDIRRGIRELRWELSGGIVNEFVVECGSDKVHTWSVLLPSNNSGALIPWCSLTRGNGNKNLPEPAETHVNSHVYYAYLSCLAEGWLCDAFSIEPRFEWQAILMSVPSTLPLNTSAISSQLPTRMLGMMYNVIRSAEYLENIAKLKERASQLTLPSYTYIVSHLQPMEFRALVNYDFYHLLMGILYLTGGK